MNSNLEKARKLLTVGGYTCVFVSDNDVITSRERGVAPLLKLYDSGSRLSDFSAADKVVGRAAAFMYVLLGARYLYAEAVSKPALEILTREGISTDYGQLVENIQNRRGDGICPLESATMPCTAPDEALVKIREKLADLKNNPTDKG